MLGKKIRMERIINRNVGKTIIIPMDHGVTLGPIPGLKNMKTTINNIVEAGVNAILLHKGMVKTGYRGTGKDVGLIIHLSASTVLGLDPNNKVLVCTLKEAIQLGADAVSVHINLGAENESLMLKDLGTISRECQEWGIPLIAMMYTRGEKITSEFDVKFVKHAARVAAELGADMVKVNYTGSVDSFREVIEGCPVPVVIAGGEKTETDEMLLKTVEGAIIAGSIGVSIGRNVFQHTEPMKMVKAISLIVHHNASVKEALKLLKN